MAFGLVASATVVAASLFEGTLLRERIVGTGANSFAQHPYIHNVSTILDFALLDPLAIYFMLKARESFKNSYTHFRKPGDLAVYHKIGLALTAVALGISAMWLYYQGYIGSTVFTEAFFMDASGRAAVSLTGWVIFVATSAFLSLLAFVTFEYGNYVFFVRRLGPEDLKFGLPPNPGRDIEIAIKPCVYAMYVLVVLFIILAIIVVRDFWQLGFHESRRTWLLAPYLLVCLVTFLPFWHLHRVMSAQKKQIIDANNSLIEVKLRPSHSRNPRKSSDASIPIDPQKLIESLDQMSKLQTFYKSITVWPSNASDLLLPNLSAIISIVALGLKVIDSMRQV